MTSERFITSDLVPPGVNDRRSRDFAEALSLVLEAFRPASLIVQDPWTVPSALLPAMTIEAGLLDLVSPGMREELLRAMLAAAPDIHAMAGTVAGVRRALKSIGITVRWTQWWQMTPKGYHDTHKAVLYFADTIVEGYQPFDLPNQRAARRIITAVKRHSQDIAVQYGMRASAILRPGSAFKRGRTIRLMAPRLGDVRFPVALWPHTKSRTIRSVRIDAKAA